MLNYLFMRKWLVKYSYWSIYHLQSFFGFIIFMTQYFRKD